MAVEKEKKEVVDTSKEKVIEKGLNPIRIVVIVVCIILSLIMYFYFRNINAARGYSNNCQPQSNVPGGDKDKPSSSKPPVVLENEISIEEGKVTSLKHLFAYEVSTISAENNSIYSETPTIIGDLPENQKITINLYDYLNLNLIDSAYVRCSELNENKVTFQCNSEGFATINGVLISMYQISTVDFANNYKKIFGQKAEFTNRSFDTLDGYSCSIAGNQYKCINLSDKAIGIETYSYIIRAFEYADRMEIQTKYVWLESEKGYSNNKHEKEYFNDFQPNPNGNNLDAIKIKSGQIDTYKHTFLKNEDQTYYWHKTELVK